MVLVSQPSPEEVWGTTFSALGQRIGHSFLRPEPRQRALAYIRGLSWLGTGHTCLTLFLTLYEVIYYQGVHAMCGPLDISSVDTTRRLERPHCSDRETSLTE